MIIALTILTETAFARSHYRCAASKVVVTNAPGRDSSVRVEEHLGFWIDDAAKTIVLLDGARPQVTRFDQSWVSARLGDIDYEFDRVAGTLTYAGSTTMGNTTTTVVGSGHCDMVPPD